MLQLPKRDFTSFLFFPVKLFPSTGFFSNKVSEAKFLLLLLRQSLRSLYFLVFVNGLLLASLLYLEMEADYDSAIFNAIVQTIKIDSVARTNQDSFLLRSMRMANSLQQNRQKVFEGREINDVKGSLLRNSMDDLLTGRGACGSASVILLRILELDGYQIRLAQMKVNGIYGGHIIIEAKKDNGWIVMDPLYNCYFKKANGSYASFEDVRNNWKYYKSFAPQDYPKEYTYEDVRYTNWEKVPIAGPLAKNILQYTLGKSTVDTISIRPYLLKNYQILFYIIQVIFIAVLLLTINKFYNRVKKHKRKQARNANNNAEAKNFIPSVQIPWQ